MTGNVAGVVVSDVLTGTPASGSDILRGDVITAMDGESVNSVPALRNRIAATPPGTRVAFTLVREGRSAPSGSRWAPNQWFRRVRGITLNL
ncbi:MAG: PDZ domain-containing protein [Marinilabiliales bacterium]|nr:PDZ domain-containing protein [Marinilabiliales bacterium]